jgi:hypothetical protein
MSKIQCDIKKKISPALFLEKPNGGNSKLPAFPAFRTDQPGVSCGQKTAMPYCTLSKPLRKVSVVVREALRYSTSKKALRTHMVTISALRITPTLNPNRTLPS